MDLVLLTIRTAIVSWRHLLLLLLLLLAPSRVCGREVESWGGSVKESQRSKDREGERVAGVAEDNTIPADSVYG